VTQTHYFNNAPLQVLDVDAEPWDEVTDLAVVGFGMAGASAALEAAEQGAKVLLIDRLAGGGASALSGGIVYAGGGTKWQREAGDDDSADNMFAYLKEEIQGAVSDETLRRFCEDSVPNIEWLERHGVNFNATPYDEKTSYPPDGFYLYYSGNELSSPFKEKAKPVRRGHRTHGEGLTGRILWGEMHDSIAASNNVDVSVHTEVQRLIVDANNRVVGLELLAAPSNPLVRGIMNRLNKLANGFCMLEPKMGKLFRAGVHKLRNQGAIRRIRAEKGVVLSTGGFINNLDMLKDYAPTYKDVRPLGEDCHGGGIMLGNSVGGALGYMDKVSAWRFFTPPSCLLKGLVVTADGRRVCSEDLYGAATSQYLVDANEGKGWLIVDEAIMTEAKRLGRPGGAIPWTQWMPIRLFIHTSTQTAKSLAELANLCNLDAEGLKAVAEKFNAGAESGNDEFNKSEKYLRALGSGPYYAVDISLDNPKVPCMSMTLGGLKVDEASGAVMNAGGQSIEGLYAAGRAAVGVCSKSYVSGLSLADCVFSGRRAAVSALEK